jgi:hypothetical protein
MNRRFLQNCIFPSKSALLSRIQGQPSAPSQTEAWVGYGRVWRQGNQFRGVSDGPGVKGKDGGDRKGKNLYKIT